MQPSMITHLRNAPPLAWVAPSFMFQQYWTSQSSLDPLQYSYLSTFVHALFFTKNIFLFIFPRGYLHIFWDQVQNLLFLEAFFMYQPVCEVKWPSSCLPLCSTLFLITAFITWCDHFLLLHKIMSFFNEGNVRIFLYPQAWHICLITKSTNFGNKKTRIWILVLLLTNHVANELYISRFHNTGM